jgi:hypothetical protein
MRIQAAALLLGLLSSSVSSLTNQVCNYKMFPVFAGGNKDEFVYTMELDQTNG